MTSIKTSALDSIDRRILGLLQRDARLTVAEIATQVSLSPSPCWRRIRHLEVQGLIAGYEARLDRRRLGYGVLGFVHLQLDSHSPSTARAFEREVCALEQVLSCHNLSGRYDYMLEVIAADLEDFSRFVRENLRGLPGVREMQSSFSLKEIKSDRRLPV